MRPSFLPEDLTRRDRGRFQLAGTSVERLRARIAGLSGGLPPYLADRARTN